MLQYCIAKPWCPVDQVLLKFRFLNAHKGPISYRLGLQGRVFRKWDILQVESTGRLLGHKGPLEGIVGAWPFLFPKCPPLKLL